MKLPEKFDSVFIFIVGVAAFLRLYQPGHGPYWVDVASTLSAASRLAHDGQMVWLGNPSAWDGLMAHSPFSVYFTAVPLFFFDAPVTTYIWFGLFGVLTIVVLYIGVERYFGIQAARITAFTIAISPLAVYWSNFVWNPNVAPFFIVCWWFTGLLGYYEHKRWAQIAHPVMLSLVIQSQTALAVMIPASGLLLIGYVIQASDKRQPILNFIAGCIISVVFAFPWFYGLYGVWAGWWDTPFGISDTKTEALQLVLPSISHLVDQFFYLVSGFRYWVRPLLIDSNRMAWWPDHSINIFPGIQSVLTLLGLCYVSWQAWQRRQGRDSLPFAFTSLAILTPFLFFFLSFRISYSYLQPVTFFGAIVFGIIVSSLMKHRQLLTICVLIPVFLAQIYLVAARHDWRVNGAQRGTTTLTEFEQQIQTWYQLTGDVVFITDRGELSTFSVREWVITLEAFDEQYPVRVLSDSHAVPIAPTGSTLAGFTAGNVIPKYFGTGTTVQTGNGGDFRYLEVTPDDLPAPDFHPQNDVTYGDLLAVDGIITGTPENNLLPVAIRWQPLKQPQSQYQFSVRLIDSNENRISQIDGSTLEPEDWRAGDTVLTRFMMPLPDNLPPKATWEFNLIVYSFPQIDNVPLSDSSGNVLRLSP
jgi:hypothetical protein